MPRRLNKEETTMNTGVLNITLSLSRKLLAEIGRMLILDVLDDRVPAASEISFFIPQTMIRSVNTICHY